MFRNNYDSDSVTFSPQGRIFQVEYACKAVKQGSSVVAIAGTDYVVLAALKRNAEELSSYQKKTRATADHIGLGFAGLSADARRLYLYIDQQAAQSHQTFGRRIPVGDLVFKLATVMQGVTQSYGSRPFGAGFLLCGYDETGTHLYEIQPSAHFVEMKAAGIGARSLMARTYLERNLEHFPDADRDTLVQHAIKALRQSLTSTKKLDTKNTSIAIVGKDHPFTIYENAEIDEWLKQAAEDSDDDFDDDDEPEPAAATTAAPTAVPAAAEPATGTEMVDVDQ